MSTEDLGGQCECEQLRAELRTATKNEAGQRDLIRELEASASLHWIMEEELKQLRADLARVNAHAAAMDTARLVADSELCQLRADLAALRSQSAEIERINENLSWKSRYDAEVRLSEVRIARSEKVEAALTALRARVDELLADNGRIAAHAAEHLRENMALKQRNAELVAALRVIADMSDDGQAGDPYSDLIAIGECAVAALAGAEPATPAKHLDTVCPKCGAQTMDPFTGTRQIHNVDKCSGPARKQGGSAHD